MALTLAMPDFTLSELDDQLVEDLLLEVLVRRRRQLLDELREAERWVHDDRLHRRERLQGLVVPPPRLSLSDSLGAHRRWRVCREWAGHFSGRRRLWEGSRVEDVATPAGLDENPALVWRFYSARRAAGQKALPTLGHTALAPVEMRLGDRFLLATQNVDGLHRRAGSQRVVALHGELFEARLSPRAARFMRMLSTFSRPLRSAVAKYPPRPRIPNSRSRFATLALDARE